MPTQREGKDSSVGGRLAQWKEGQFHEGEGQLSGMKDSSGTARSEEGKASSEGRKTSPMGKNVRTASSVEEKAN
jgi:hypothetical protein